MFRLISGLVVLSSVLSAASIHFDGLLAGTDSTVSVVPAGAFSPVTFSTPAGAALYVWAEAHHWQGDPAASLPNVVCSAYDSAPKNCIADLTISFGEAVNALSLWTGAWTQFGSQLVVEVYTGSAVLATSFTVTSPQSFNNKLLIDVSTLSGIANITSIRLVNPVNNFDPFGVVLDRITYTGSSAPPPPPPPTIPEPGSVLLTVSGLAGFLAFRRR